MVEEHWTTRRQVGSRYDFVLKRVRPIYRERDQHRVVASPVVTTGPDGTFRFDLPASAGRSYRITATYQETGDELLVADAWAEDATVNHEGEDPRLVVPGAIDDERTYGIGDPIRLRFAGGTTTPRAERYLFAVLQRGLRSVGVQASPAFRATFTADDVPGVQVQGVRFTGYGYEEASKAMACNTAPATVTSTSASRQIAPATRPATPPR